MDQDLSNSDSESSSQFKNLTDANGITRKTKIMLIKGIPKQTTPDEIRIALGVWGKINRFVKKPFTNHYYLEYEVNPFLSSQWSLQISYRII